MALFIIVGVVKIFCSRLAAYRMFKVAILIGMFLTQVFVFYHLQFEALWGFGFGLLLFALNDMIDREEALIALGRLGLKS